MKMKSGKRRRGAKLGQHFLNNPTVARALVAAATIKTDDTVIEIGPGTGALTRELLHAGGVVLAIEKDPTLVALLQKTFALEIRNKRLIVREEDVRDFSPERAHVSGEYVLAANIPYYITGEIIRQFLTTPAQPRTIALLIQKEVADRIVAKDGKESVLSLSVKAYGDPRIIRKVSAGNFTPPPSVDSAILVINNISRKFFDGINESLFFTIVKLGFSAKRKKVRSNLARAYAPEAVEEACNAAQISANARAEDLSLDIWRTLTERLGKQ